MGQDGGKGEYGERGPKGDIGPEVKYDNSNVLFSQILYFFHIKFYLT